MLNPKELTASITAIANTLACKLTKDELVYWGVVLSQLGTTMSTIAALQELCEKSGSSTEEAAVTEEISAGEADAALSSQLLS